MKISQAFEDYIELSVKPRGLSIHTVEQYQRTEASFLTFVGDKALEEITIRDIAKYGAELGRTNKNRSIAFYLSALRSVFKYWGRHGVECLSYEDINKPKYIKTEPAFLTAAEVDKMVTAAGSMRDKFIIALLYSTGLRVSEACNANICDIDGNRMKTIGKGRKPRTVFLDRRAWWLKIRYLGGRDGSNPALFTTKRGKRVRAREIQAAVRETAKKAGMRKKVTPHTLRHSFATNFVANGGEIVALMRIMGHSDIETTMVYVHMVDEDAERQFLKCHSL